MQPGLHYCIFVCMCAEHMLQCFEVVLGVVRHWATVDLGSVPEM